MGSSDRLPELTLRRATDTDRPATIDLCRASLGWKPGDPNEAFFEWKHDRNPFGRSPAWVAVSPDNEIVGLRVFLCWEFEEPGSTNRITAVRAVDTATHPDWQGKGIFTKLTLAAVEELKQDGLDLVFNTPNDQSRPGYIKMGWQVVGRVPVEVRVRSVTSAARLRGAKAAAEKWSAGTTAGIDAREVLSDSDALGQLVAKLPPVTGIRTARSVEYYQWRYEFEPLGYRALPLGDRLEDGVVLFRVRKRGTATELTICDVLAPASTSAGRTRKAIGNLLRAAGADYAIGAAAPTLVASLRSGSIPVNRLGPIFTWREVSRPGIPEMGDLSLTLGDIELF